MVLLGFAAVFFSGFICGVAPLPIKFMRSFRYEHWGLLSSFLAFLAIPAVALCVLCPDLPGALADMPARPLVVANLLSFAWGIDNILYLLSLGVSFSFVYTQDPIGQVFAAHGVAERDVPTAVRIVTLLGGTAANLLYPIFLLCRNRSWGVFFERGAWREALLAVPFAVLTILSFVSGSVGMVMMGALGSSVGFGASLAMQIVSAQSIGLLFGEWKGVERRYTCLMVAALALMLLGLAVISAGQGER